MTGFPKNSGICMNYSVLIDKHFLAGKWDNLGICRESTPFKLPRSPYFTFESPGGRDFIPLPVSPGVFRSCFKLNCKAQEQSTERIKQESHFIRMLDDPLSATRCAWLRNCWKRFETSP
jgi:hypothetical protein